MNTEENLNECAEMARQAAATEAACATERPAKVETPEPSFFLTFPKISGKAVMIGAVLLALFAIAEFAFSL